MAFGFSPPRYRLIAVFLISEDLDEVLALSDRVAPIYEGKLMDIIPAADINRDKIGALMAGMKLGVTE